jgi:ankyrin repeat protein
MTALMHALRDGHPTNVRALLDDGVGRELKAVDRDGMTALMYATRRDGDTESLLIHALLDASLIDAATRGDRHLVVTLLTTPKTVAEKNGGEALGAAVAEQDLHVLCHKVITEGIRPHVNAFDHTGSTALIHASSQGHADIVHALVKNGANVVAKNYEGATALIYASIRGHSHVLSQLLFEGAGLIPEGETDPFQDMATDDGRTPLMYASAKGHVDAVRLLVSYGARVDRRDGGGYMALLLASESGHVDVVKELLTCGAEINVHTFMTQSTPLILASTKGHTHIVHELLRHQDLNVNAVRYGGMTALMAASCHGRVDVVKMLLAAPGVREDGVINSMTTPHRT